MSCIPFLTKEDPSVAAAAVCGVEFSNFNIDVDTLIFTIFGEVYYTINDTAFSLINAPISKLAPSANIVNVCVTIV